MRQLWDEQMKSQNAFKALPSLSSQCLDLTSISTEWGPALLGVPYPLQPPLHLEEVSAIFNHQIGLTLTIPTPPTKAGRGQNSPGEE